MTPDTRRHEVLAWVSLLARLGLGGVMLVAGVLKMGDLGQSVVAVQAYQFPLPLWAETTVGYCLPVAEILVGVVLIAGAFTRWTAILAGVVMIAYIAAITSAWARGLAIDCGCFTPGGVLLDPGQKTKYAQDIARDIGFLMVAGWLAIFPVSRWSVDSWLRTTDKDIDGIE